MHATMKGTGRLNALLRGELAAAETYDQALDKLRNDRAWGELHRIHEEHEDAVQTLRDHVMQRAGEPEIGSGVWGAWARFVEGTANLFGKTAALKALREGEKHGARHYQEALYDSTLPEECKELIRSRLLPQTRVHVEALERILKDR